MSETSQTKPVARVIDLVVDYRSGRKAAFRAVDNVSFEIDQGETVGLVGESGSGKTSIARAVQGLVPSAGGTIELAGRIHPTRRVRDRRALAAVVQTVFQDPFGSLNPSRSIGAILEEPLMVQEPSLSRKDVRRRVDQELARVGLRTGSAEKRPREFSGGQRQRIAIARALIGRPRLVICDEAVSALDLSIQAQILNLLADIQAERGVSYLFITHDLAVVRHIADRVVVLRQGRAVDQFGSANPDTSLWSPYTRALFDAAPVPDPAMQREKRRQFEKMRHEDCHEKAKNHV